MVDSRSTVYHFLHYDCGTTVENAVADNIYLRSALDYLIYDDPEAYAELILKGDPETYLKTVTEYKHLDS